LCQFVCCLMDRLLGRDRFQRMKDAYCGLCILAMYFLYLMVVKGALSVFDCSKVPANCKVFCMLTRESRVAGPLDSRLVFSS
jgi:hypothetical protein